MGACALDASSVPVVLQDVLNGFRTVTKLHMGTGLLLCDQAFWGIIRLHKLPKEKSNIIKIQASKST